jgi:alkyl sulfatase BDS1-like metallo-beta-lactamase superfamily hydrolase
MKSFKYAVLAASVLMATGCGKNTGVGGTAGDATPTTIAANAEFAKNLNFTDRQDFEASLPSPLARSCSPMARC